MYESPLTKIYGTIQNQIVKQDEENTMYVVNRAVGYDVDKEELIKALNYDRDQYKKGYADAMAVIEDVKAEITAKYDSIPFRYNYYDDGWIDGLEWVLNVIDKHMRGKTNET